MLDIYISIHTSIHETGCSALYDDIYHTAPVVGYGNEDDNYN